MVNKARQMLNHLQAKADRLKNRADNYENQLKRKNESPLDNSLSTDGLIEEIKKKADNSINEVKRQAHVEIQRAVTSSENKSNEILKKERERFDKILEDIKRKYLISASNTKQEDNLLEVKKKKLQ